MRVKFPAGKQKRFLEKALFSLGRDQSELSKISGVCERTSKDWKREKYNMDLRSLEKICERLKRNLPQDIKILPEYWSVKKASRLGGRRYVELYGSPGTPEGRRKGGRSTQRKLRFDPNFAKRTRLVVRKKIKHPKKSALLTEFIGIMLGDGNIRSNYQIAISFNSKEDLKYAYYIQRLITNLFLVSSTIRIRDKDNSGEVVASGRNIVEFLTKCGLKKGDKVAGRVDIPQWIWGLESYKIACLKGLVDTDGCFYHHRYVVSGKEYTYLKMCFTSYSPPLLKSVTTILEDLNLQPKNTAKNRVYLYSLSKLHRYFKIVGTSNPRYLRTYKNFCNSL